MCSKCTAKKQQTIKISDLVMGDVRYALTKNEAIASPVPAKKKLEHQECGSRLVPAAGGRWACCSCLKTGYLLAAPDTTRGSSDDDEDDD